MPTWDEATPYTERSTFSRHASVTNALVGVHLAALAVAAISYFANWRVFLEAAEFKTISAVYGLQVWRFITYPFAHTLDPASLVAFAVLGWLFVRAGNELERDWGGARMLGFCTAMALYGAAAQAALDVFTGAAGDFQTQGIGGFHAPILGVLLAATLRNPRRPVLLFLVLPMRAVTFFWLVFGAALLYSVALFRQVTGPSPLAIAGAVAAAWAYSRLDPRLDRFLEWLDTRRARAKFLEEFELRAQVDLLLEKIQRSGMESLSRQERRTLRRASGLYRPPARTPHE